MLHHDNQFLLLLVTYPFTLLEGTSEYSSHRIYTFFEFDSTHFFYLFRSQTFHRSIDLALRDDPKKKRKRKRKETMASVAEMRSGGFPRRLVEKVGGQDSGGSIVLHQRETRSLALRNRSIPLITIEQESLWRARS